MEKIQPIIWDGERLLLLDQRALPLNEIYISCSSAEEVGECIRRMAVRGAPAIGVAAAFAMVLAARQIAPSLEKDEAFLDKLAETGTILKNIRPTAVNLSWGTDQILVKAKSLLGMSPGELLEHLENTALNIYHDDISVNKQIGEYGAALIPSPCSILTHCNAGALATAGYGTALGVIRSAFFSGKDIHVFADETRPFLQGSRLTAWELQKEGIPVTLIVDSAAGYFLSTGQIDCVIVGADRIAANGDVANKIGTYTLAVLAEKHNVPFYVAAPVSTFDLSAAAGGSIVVENRSEAEVTHLQEVAIAPPGIRAQNPSFDITPAQLIRAIITENGVIVNPNQLNISRTLAYER